MSRTRKGSKGLGYEVDRRREGKRGYRSAGAVAKRIGVRSQRRQGQAIVARESSSFAADEAARNDWLEWCSITGEAP